MKITKDNKELEEDKYTLKKEYKLLTKMKRRIDEAFNLYLFFFLLITAGVGFIFGSFALLFWFIEYGADPSLILWSFKIFEFMITMGFVFITFKIYLWFIGKICLPALDKVISRRKNKMYENYSALAKMIAKEISMIKTKSNKKKK